MRIDPQLDALRGDSASRRAMQAALESARDAWLEGAAKPLVRELKDYDRGQKFSACLHLADLFKDIDTARGLIDELVEPMMVEISGNPLGHVPLRHQRSDNLAIIELLKVGRVTMTLIAYDELDIEPSSVNFGGGERHELVLAGAADFLLVELLGEDDASARLETNNRRIVAGESIRCDDGRSTRLVRRVEGRLVMLRLARADDDPPETRQYALSDGRLLHRASGSRDESRREMAMALLGRMGRTDAAPLLAELSLEGSAHIRWQSLRETLALDSRAGFDALSRIAADPADALCAPAAALHARLIETYPQFAITEANTCHA